MQMRRRTKQTSVAHDASALEIEADPFAYALRHVAVAMVGADKVVTFSEREDALALVTGFMNGAYTPQQLHDDIASFSGEDLGSVLSSLTPRLTPAKRDVVLRVAIELAVSNGAMLRSEFLMLQSVAEGLGVSTEHLGEVISHLSFSRD